MKRSDIDPALIRDVQRLFDEYGPQGVLTTVARLWAERADQEDAAAAAASSRPKAWPIQGAMPARLLGACMNCGRTVERRDGYPSWAHADTGNTYCHDLPNTPP